EGLSYSVGSSLSADSFFPRAGFGAFAIYAPQNRARVEAAIREEIQKAVTEGFTEQEGEAGKKGFLQARQLARSTDGRGAGGPVSYLVLGRTFAWDEELERKVSALTPAVILDAMRRRIDPSRMSFYKAGDFANVAANKGANRAN